MLLASYYPLFIGKDAMSTIEVINSIFPKAKNVFNIRSITDKKLLENKINEMYKVLENDSAFAFKSISAAHWNALRANLSKIICSKFQLSSTRESAGIRSAAMKLFELFINSAYKAKVEEETGKSTDRAGAFGSIQIREAEVRGLVPKVIAVKSLDPAHSAFSINKIHKEAEIHYTLTTKAMHTFKKMPAIGFHGYWANG